VIFDHQHARGESAPSSLWTVGANGRGLHRLTDPRGASDAGPIISPNGRRIVFLRSRGTGESIVSQSVVMNTDGSKLKVLFDYSDYSVGNAVWSPDSRSIAFNPGNELWIVNASTGSRHATPTEEAGLLDWQALPGGPTVRCADRKSATIPKTAPPVNGLG
jgi:Tol biopolymer transport system component